MNEYLFLAHRIPFPPDRGDKIRSWHILQALARLGTVHLATFADDKVDAGHLAALREALGGRLGEAHVEVRKSGRLIAGARAIAQGKPLSLTAFDSPDLRAFAARIVGQRPVSTVFAFSGQMAQFVPPGIRLVMDFVDVDSAKFEAYAGQGGPLALLYRREARMLARFERETAARAAVSLFVSEAEAALFRSRVDLRDGDVRALHNGVDLDFYDPAPGYPRPLRSGEPLIVFTGQMDYAPNEDAVQWFADEVLPGVTGATFAIVGRNPSPAVQRLGKRQRVLVTGGVPDTRIWLAAADVVVAPLRIARGVQNKVLEAMAMGRPVVASPAAFDGIEASPGRELIVAESAAEQAKAIRLLLSDPVRAGTIGRAARRRMEEAYRWAVRLAPLQEIVAPDVRQAAA